MATSTATFRSVSSLRRHEHACLLYGSEDERATVVAAYVRAGLAAGERVIHVTDDGCERVVAALATAGLAVGDRELDVWPAAALHGAAGGSDLDATSALWRAEAAAATADGFTGLRIVGEMARAADAEDLPAYERAVAGVLRQVPATALCLYDGRRFGAVELLQAAEAHPAVLCGAPHHHAEPPVAEDALTAALAGPRRIRLAGTADLATAPALADVLALTMGRGGDLSVDAGALAFADSAGMQPLCDAGFRLAAAGHVVRVEGARPQLRRLADLLGLDEGPGLLFVAEGAS